MIDVFYRVRGAEELMHPRVRVTTAPDAERGLDLIEILNDCLPVDGDLAPAGGRPSRKRGTVAQLLKWKAASDARPAAKTAAGQPTLLHLVAGKRA